MLQELNNFINIFKNFWGNQLNSLFLPSIVWPVSCSYSQEGVKKSKFNWTLKNPWKRQFKCTEIVQFLKHLLIKLFCLSRLMDENLWGFTKLKKTKILKISAFYLNKQKSFIPNAMPSVMQFPCNISFDVRN